MSLACPCCGFRTIPEQGYGTYHVCEVCGWEDDGLQLANPSSGGGANHESLVEAQRSALLEHPISTREFAGVHRDDSWRPLSDDEVALAVAERSRERWLHAAVLVPEDAYWRRAALASNAVAPAQGRDERFVSTLPLEELWRTRREHPARRERDLGREDLRQLLEHGPVDFVVAAVGSSLRWVDRADCYRFWKEDVRAHLAEPDAAVILEDFSDEYAYWASEWRDEELAPIVLLQMVH